MIRSDSKTIPLCLTLLKCGKGKVKNKMKHSSLLLRTSDRWQYSKVDKSDSQLDFIIILLRYY